MGHEPVTKMAPDGANCMKVDNSVLLTGGSSVALPRDDYKHFCSYL